MYQAVSAEQAKWEAREERLVEQLTETKERLKSWQNGGIERPLSSDGLAAADPASCQAGIRHQDRDVETI